MNIDNLEKVAIGAKMQAQQNSEQLSQIAQLIGSPVGVWKDGYFISSATGNEVADAAYSYVTFAVAPSKQFSISGVTSAADSPGIAFRTSAGAFISGYKNQVAATYTFSFNVPIPATAATVQISCRTAYKNIFSLTSDALSGVYKYTVNAVGAVSFSPVLSWSHTGEYSVHVGKQSRIYFDQISVHNVNGFYKVSASGANYPEVTCSDTYVEFNFSSAKTVTLTITFVAYDGTPIGNTSITVVARAVGTYPVKKYLFLGDSLTAEATMITYIKDAIGANCTLYGTLGSGAYLHEGRVGWSINDYNTLADKGGVTNPFFNPTPSKFDFAYYIANNPTFSTVTNVNILLGQNDGYDTTKISTLKLMVESIKAYSAAIKITVMCLHNVAVDVGTGQYMQSGYDYRAKTKIWNNEIRTILGAISNVTIVPQHYNLDSYWDWERGGVVVSYLSAETKTVFTNNVHPSAIGMKKFGDVFLAYVTKLG